jgi:ribonuclease P protein component
MERRLRLRSESDFAHVRADGRAWRDRLMTMLILPNGGPDNRYGFVVSKRVGNAVTRNRIKRRLREIFRQLDRAGLLASGYDLVIIVRPGLALVSFAELTAAVQALLKRARLLLPAPSPPHTEP